eukprot:scaffold46019_cov54-Phaeocystis_antarctica.AAC.2
MHHLAVVAVVPGSGAGRWSVGCAAAGVVVVEFSFVNTDGSLWKLACYWRVHSVKADFQSTVPHKNKTRGPTATSHPSYDDPTVATGT